MWDDGMQGQGAKHLPYQQWPTVTVSDLTINNMPLYYHKLTDVAG